MYEENNSQDTDEEKSSEKIQNDDGNDSQVKSVEDQGTCIRRHLTGLTLIDERGF